MLPPSVDGIVGIDVLRTFRAVDFDWEARTLRLHRASEPPRAPAADGAAVIPFVFRRVSAGDLPFVRATFGDAPACDALLDTGSPK